MSLSLRTLSPHPRRRLVLALVLAILLAGFAQAAHFHKGELAGHPTQTEIHCLLCLFAAGTAGPPALPGRAPAPAPQFARPILVSVIRILRAAPAAYDARGPPTA
jgi:hypothetical protein